MGYVRHLSSLNVFDGSTSPTTKRSVSSPEERKVTALLCKVVNPDTKEDIVMSGMVTSIAEKNGTVSISLQLDKNFRSLKKNIETLLAPLDFVKSVRVSMAPTEKDPNSLAPLKPQSHRQGHISRAGAVGPRGLSDVKAVIAVSSGKGGVGKSSVSVNLAYAISLLDHADGTPLRVGILDADIHGPSLPVMVSPSDTTLQEFVTPEGDSLIEPLLYEGVKLMSYGYVPSNRVITGDKEKDKDGVASAIMRGPMTAQIMNELATRTNWGDLDYLVIDMPPGTGDIALTLTQNIKISGAVIVTTPQKLAYIDVVRGVDLFDLTSVPVLGIVQNMSYFVAPNDPTQTKHYIFGNGDQYVSKLQKDYGIKHNFTLPIVPSIADYSDHGDPFVLQTLTNPENIKNSEISVNDYSNLANECKSEYNRLASMVHEACGSKAAIDSLKKHDYTLRYDSELNQIQIYSTQAIFEEKSEESTSSATPSSTSSSAIPTTSVNSPVSSDSSSSCKSGNSKISEKLTPLHTINPRELRLACKCAACVHEFTGAPLLNPHKVSPHVHPKSMVNRGQYAVSISWSDGHQSSMYPWKQMLELAQNTSS